MILETIFYVMVMFSGLWWLIAKVTAPMFLKFFIKLGSIYIITWSILHLLTMYGLLDVSINF